MSDERVGRPRPVDPALGQLHARRRSAPRRRPARASSAKRRRAASTTHAANTSVATVGNAPEVGDHLRHVHRRSSCAGRRPGPAARGRPAWSPGRRREHRVEHEHVGADPGDRRRGGQLEAQPARGDPLLEERAGGAARPQAGRTSRLQSGWRARNAGPTTGRSPWRSIQSASRRRSSSLAQPPDHVDHADDHRDRHPEGERGLARDRPPPGRTTGRRRSRGP